jgi:hypothetical protein
MTDEQINKDLHEKVMKKCWHEFETKLSSYICKKCGFRHDNSILLREVRENLTTNYYTIPSYTTNPSDYWELLQKVKEDERYPQFIRSLEDVWWGLSNIDNKDYSPADFIFKLFSDTHRGSQAIWEFFCK